MTVTVVIPAYRAESMLGATLDSVLAQTVRPERVIVIDDGSDDATADVARRHPVKPDVVVQPNSGPAAARNHGAFLAGSEWLAFLDHDDLWHAQHLELALDAARRSHADLVAARTVSFVLLDGTDPGPRARWADITVTRDQLEHALSENLSSQWGSAQIDPMQAATTGVTPTPSAVLVRRETLARAGGFPVLFNTPNDVACYYQVSRIGSVVTNEAPTAYFRVHGASMSELGSETEVTNLAAFVAMWYGNDLKPHRVAAHRDGLHEFGRRYGVDRLRFLLADATDRSNAWRLPVERAFEDLLVPDAETRRILRRLRLKRRIEIAAPRPARLARRIVRGLRAGGRG